MKIFTAAGEFTNRTETLWMELFEYTIRTTTKSMIGIKPAERCFGVKRKLKVIKTAADCTADLYSCTHVRSILWIMIMNWTASIRDAEHPPCINIHQPTFYRLLFACLFFFFRVEYCAIIVSGILADAFLIWQQRFRQLFPVGAARTEVSSQTLGADSIGRSSSLQLSLTALRLNKQDCI